MPAEDGPSAAGDAAVVDLANAAQSATVATIDANGATVAFARRQIRTLRLAPACPAEFSADGTVDFFDYLDFVTVFDAGC